MSRFITVSFREMVRSIVIGDSRIPGGDLPGACAQPEAPPLETG
jgi:hypothetical protein